MGGRCHGQMVRQCGPAARGRCSLRRDVPRRRRRCRAAGVALARAQDDLAESLRTFNDLPGDHTTLGWLEASRGRADEAAAELRTAIDLDPRAARPRVYLGVVAARAGKYDEAVRHWKAAKELAPAYPNLDRLIEEAQKRLKNP